MARRNRPAVDKDQQNAVLGFCIGTLLVIGVGVGAELTMEAHHITAATQIVAGLRCALGNPGACLVYMMSGGQ